MLAEKVRAIQQSSVKPNILVIGDLMIDHYIWGAATRLSPEAPVPVVNVRNESTTLGGAGNLTQNLVALGAKVSVAGVIGNDAAGQQLKDILEAEEVSTTAIITDNNRPTTIKTRVLAGSHQLVRIDREVTDNLSDELEAELLKQVDAGIAEADIVVFSDYNKGLFSANLTQKLIAIAMFKNKRVVIDPKGLDYSKYKGAYVIKPNRKELAEAAKAEKIRSTEDLRAAADTILAQTDAVFLVVTLSEEGMAIIDKNTVDMLSVKATSVFDVTGAGDTVLASIAYFVAAGLTLHEACELANHAAAVVIRRVGSVTATIDEILNDMNDAR